MTPQGYGMTGTFDPVTLQQISIRQDGVYADISKFSIAGPFTNFLIVDDLQLNPSGIGNSAISSRTLSTIIGGFPVQFSKWQVVDNKINIGNIAVSLPENCDPHTLIIKTSVFNAVDFTLGTSIDPVNVTDSGWNILFNKVSFAGDVQNGFLLTGEGSLQLSSELGLTQLIFPEMILGLDGTIKSGKGYSTSDVINEMRISGWYMEVTGFELIRSGTALNLSILNAVLNFPDLYKIDESTLEFKDILIDNTGHLINKGTYVIPPSGNPYFSSYNNYPVSVRYAELADNGINLAADVTLPQRVGGKVINIGTEADPSLFLDDNGFIISGILNDPVLLDISGFPLTATEYSFKRSNFTVYESSIMVDNTNSFVISEFGLYSDGTVMYCKSYQGDLDPVIIGGWEFGITDITITDTGLQLRSFITFPPELGGASVYFHDLTFYKINGVLQISSSVYVPLLEFDFMECHFKFEGIFWDNGSFYIADAVITLPPELQDTQITLSNFSVLSDGSFRIGSLSVDPFDLWGMTFDISHIGFENDTISFNGKVTFGYDFGIPELVGRTVSINEFSYNFSNGTLVFDISLDQIDIELADGWTVQLKDIGITNDSIYAGQAKLLFPSDWLEFLSVESVGISDFSFNFMDGSFSLGKVSAENIKFTIEGFECTLSEISYDDVDGLILAGTFPLDGLFDENAEVPPIQFNRLQITPDFKIGDIDVDFPLHNIELAKGIQYSGTLSVDKNIDKFEISLSGVFNFTNQFPIEELRSSSLDIGIVAFDIIQKRFTEIDATFNADEMTILGVDLTEFKLRYAKTREMTAATFSAAAFTTIPAEVPGFGGVEAGVFIEIDFSEGLTDYYVYASNNFSIEAYPGVVLREQSKIESRLNDNKDGIILRISEGAFDFTENFAIEGLIGSELSINDFKIDTKVGITACDISFNAGSDSYISLGNDIDVYGFNIALENIPGTRILQFRVNGEIHFPDDFANGIIIHIEDFTIDTTGKVNFDAQVNNVNCTFFNSVTLENGSLRISTPFYPDASSTRTELMFSFSGELGFDENAPLPDDVKGIKLNINKLQFGTLSGLKEFDAEVDPSSIGEFELFAGIKASFKKIAFSDIGFTIDATVSFPENFFGLDSKTDLKVGIAMTWDGTLTKLSAGIDYMALDLFGFQLNVTNLEFKVDELTYEKSIKCESAVLIMPDTLGGNAIGLKNIVIDDKGEFSCEFDVPMLAFDIAGCHIEMYRPEFTDEISFARVFFTLPSALGGATFDIDGLTIGSDGIKIKGGTFKLPEFTIAGGLRFSDVFVQYEVDEKGEYTIGGGGRVFIPEVGEMSAAVVFTNVRPAYPIGLKYAEFSFSIAGLGIPIGTTGMYMNGIKGAIAFGPPGDEMPEFLRNIFAAGCRLNFEIGLRDATGSIQARPGLWINVDNFDFALYGYFSFLDGLVTAYTEASITKKWGFEARVELEIKIGMNKNKPNMELHGMARIHIWEYNGTKFCGEVVVRIYINKGGLILFGLPTKRIELGPAGIEFGDFANGKKGFKGYIDTKIPLVGIVGVFIDSNFKVDFGDVSQYVLLDKTLGVSRSRSLSRTSPGINGYSEKPLDFRILDGTKGKLEKEYVFSVPTRTNIPAQQSAAGNVPVNNLSKNLSRAYIPEDYLFESGLERIVFGITFDSGDPILTAVAPNGQQFSEGSDGVIVHRENNMIAIAVLNPTGGIWSLNVSQLPADVEYNVEVWGKGNLPFAEITSPVYESYSVNSNLVINGKYNSYTGNEPTITMYLSQHRNSSTGEILGTAQLNQDGTFSYNFDTLTYPNGEYFLYTGLDDGINPERNFHAAGSIIVNNDPSSLLPVHDLIISDLGNGRMEITFKDSNGKRSAGYKAVITNTGTNEIESILLGSLQNLTLSGFEEHIPYQVQIIAYDIDSNESAASESSIIKLGSEQIATENYFTVATPMTVIMPIQNHSQVIIPLIVETAFETGTAQDFADITITDSPEWLISMISDPVISLVGSNPVFNISLSASDVPLPGVYQMSFQITNLGNRNITVPIEVNIEIVFPQPEITSISPDKWHSLDSAVVNIYGSGFISETEVYLDGTRIQLDNIQKKMIQLSVPAGLIEGAHIFEVVNPSGLKSTEDIIITAPSYAVLGYKVYGKAKAGQTTEFFIGIAGLDRFSGSALFTASVIPAGWNASFIDPYIDEDQIGVLSVQVPANEANGEYTVRIATDIGSEFDLVIEVTDTEIMPFISSLSDVSALAGTAIDIFGYGFGLTGTVLVNGIEAENISWSNDRITLIVPAGIGSGQIQVVTALGTSNAVEFEQQDKLFALYPSKEEVFMEAGQTIIVPVYVYGTVPSVDVSTDSSSPAVSAVSALSNAETGTTIDLEITSSGNCPDGSYEITVNSQYETNIKTQTITVIVGKSFYLSDTTLPEGIAGLPYSSSVEAIHGQGDLQYLLYDRELPGGLTLSKDGIISGVPLHPGLYTFDVAVYDSHSREAIGTIILEISFNIWAENKWSDNGSGWNPVSGPAELYQSWKNESDDIFNSIITTPERVILMGVQSVLAFNIDTGQPIYQRPITAIQSEYYNGILYLRDIDNILYTLDADFGYTLAEQTDIFWFSIVNGQLEYTREDGTSSSGIASEVTDGVFVHDRKQWIYSVGSKIYKADNIPSKTSFYTGSNIIRDLAVLNEYLYILEVSGDFSITDMNGALQSSINSRHLDGSILSNGSVSVLYSSLGISLYDSNMNVLHDEYENVSSALLAGEYLYYVTDTNLFAVNTYSGRIIFSKSFNANAIISSGTNLFLTDKSGNVIKYRGMINPEGPDVTLYPHPAVPDGENNYYISAVTVDREAEDRETVVESFIYRINDSEWYPSESDIALPEGKVRLEVYAVDSMGLSGAPVILELDSDLTKPVTEYTLIGTTAPNGVYILPPYLQITSEDENSGIDVIEYSFDSSIWNTYTDQVQLPPAANKIVYYRSKDKAGNYSEMKSLTYTCDITPPTLKLTSSEYTGLTIITLTAEDDIQVTAVTYQINNGEMKEYSKPFALEEGTYTIRFMAEDLAEHTSGWLEETIVVAPLTSYEWISNIHFAVDSRRSEVVRNIQIGDTIFNPSRARHNKFDYLPDYLIGADYIRTTYRGRKEKGLDFITFTAGIDIDVYIGVHAYSKADLTGWVFVEEAVELENDRYFTRGADIYRKSFRKGDLVSIPGPAIRRKGTGNAYFVQASRDNLYAVLGPANGTELYPSLNYNYRIVGVTEPLGISVWTYRVNNGTWTTMGSGEALTFTPPYVSEDSTLEIKAVFTGELGEVVKTVAYALNNDSDIYMINPGPGMPVLRNKTINPEVKAWNIFGYRVNLEALSYRFINATGTGEWMDTDSFINIPDDAETLEVKITAKDLGSILREEIFTYPCVEIYEPVNFTFDDYTGEFPSETAPYHGFTEDMDEKEVKVLLATLVRNGRRYRVEREIKTSVLMPDDSSYKIHTGSGSYRITLKTGPVSWRQQQSITIDGQEFELSRKRIGNVYEITVDVDTTDEFITIETSGSPPILEISVLPLTNEDEPVAAEIKKVENQLAAILYHYRDASTRLSTSDDDRKKDKFDEDDRKKDKDDKEDDRDENDYKDDKRENSKDWKDPVKNLLKAFDFDDGYEWKEWDSEEQSEWFEDFIDDFERERW